MTFGAAALKSWKLKPLGQIADVRGGGTPSKENPAFWAGDIPWVSPKDMKTRKIVSSIDCITTEAIKNSATSLIPKGSILIVVRSGILARTVPMGITTRDLTVNQDIKAICPKRELDSQFLLYFMEKSESDLLKFVTRGATVHRIESDRIKNLVVPLPLLPEQRRVVAILDESLAGLETMRSQAEKNLHNAHDLFQSELQSALTPHPRGWREKALDEVADSNCTLSYGIVQPGTEVPQGLPIVRPTDLVAKVITLQGLKRIDPKLADGYRRTTLLGGELLLCVRGSTGMVSVAAPELAGANVTRGIVPVRFKPTEISADFGYYLMRSTQIQNQIREKTYGTALMQINIRDLRNIALSFPPLAEQQEIATKLDTVALDTQSLASVYTRKLACIAELKQSLLQKAFSGQLTSSESLAA
jgi:type I restriction enzyme, S subunit